MGVRRRRHSGRDKSSEQLYLIAIQPKPQMQNINVLLNVVKAIFFKKVGRVGSNQMSTDE